LAAPLILDLCILCELMQRITWRTDGMRTPEQLATVCSPLSYLLKAPMVNPGQPVVNALFAQRFCVVNLLRACLGLPPENHLGLEHITTRQLRGAEGY
jgi:myo-inositol-1-phosphate synthase